MFLVFFFSSRRRHTRYIGDWSSDVCSSDLPGHLETMGTAKGRIPETAPWPRARHGGTCAGRGRHLDRQHGCHSVKRSEERRVGKSVDLDGRGIIKKTNKTIKNE